MTGWVRIQAPAGMLVQVGINSANVIGTPCQLSVAGGGNIFSAWVRSAEIDVDTVFYLTNHTATDEDVPFKFQGVAPPTDTTVKVPAFSMVQAPASAYVG